jgi:hypothetical protein
MFQIPRMNFKGWALSLSGGHRLVWSGNTSPGEPVMVTLGTDALVFSCAVKSVPLAGEYHPVSRVERMGSADKVSAVAAHLLDKHPDITFVHILPRRQFDDAGTTIIIEHPVTGSLRGHAGVVIGAATDSAFTLCH